MANLFSGYKDQPSYGTSNSEGALPTGARNLFDQQTNVYTGSGSQSRLPKWQTGGNLDSQANGWNTPFYQEMFRQIDDVSSGKQPDLYGRNDYTGIATQDVQGKTYGDIWENGKKTGNVYEMYGKAAADQMMAQLTLDVETQRQTFSKLQKDPEALSRTLQEKRQESNKEYEGWLSQQDFQGSVQEGLDKDDTAEDAFTTAAGTAGGAVTGAALGTLIAPGVGTLIGAGAGAIAGGLGAWLNQDQTSTERARTDAMMEQAEELDNPTLKASTWLQGAGQQLGRAINPLSNLTQGIADAAYGTVGDEKAGFYATNDEGQRLANAGWQVANAVASFGDAALTMLNPISAGVYTATMGSRVVGGMGALASGYSFDDRTGAFDDMSDNTFGQQAAAWMNVGVDAAQMAFFRGLGTKATNQYRASAGKELKAAGELRGGYSFQKNAKGEVTDKKLYWTTFVAPSETVGAISTRLAAQRLAAQRGGGAISADDFYRAATAMENGSRKLTSAIVNGYGESLEEGLQAFLEPTSHGWDVEADDLLESMLMGFTMGAGFTLGSQSRRSWSDPDFQTFMANHPKAGKLVNWLSTPGASNEDRLYSQYEANELVNNREPMSREEFRKLSRNDQASVALVNPLLETTFRSAAENLEKSQRSDELASIAMLEQKEDAARLMRDKELGKLNPKMNGGFQISQTNASEGNPSYVAQFSIKQVAELYRRAAMGFKIQHDKLVRDKAPEEQQTQAAEVLAAATQIAQTAKQLATRHGQVDSLREKNRISTQLNDFLKEGWDSDDYATQRATSMLFVRFPTDQSGSYPVLLPQVNFELANSGNAEGGMLVSHSILAAIGGDFDGDRMQTQAEYYMTPTQFAELRAGMGFLGNSSEVNIETRGYEEAQLQMLGEAFRLDPSSDLHRAAALVPRKISKRIKEMFPQWSQQSKADLQVILKTFEENVKGGSPTARADLLRMLNEQFSDLIMQQGQETRTNLWFEISDEVQTRLQEFQTTFAEEQTKMRAAERQNADPRNPNNRPGFTHLDRVRFEQAATDGATLAILAPGSDMFRLYQQLHYSKWNAPVLSATAKTTELPLQDLIEFYEILSDNLTEQAVSRLTSSEEPIQRVLSQLDSIHRDAVKNGYKGTVATIANSYFPDLRTDDQGNQYAVSGLTLAQVLLKRENERDKQRNAINPKAEQEARWAKRNAMVEPGKGADAFLEVFGEQTLFQLGGASFNSARSNLTLRQFTLSLAIKTPEARATMLRRLRFEPDYKRSEKEVSKATYAPTQLENEHWSSYQTTVDVIAEMANKQFTYDAEQGLVKPSAEYGKVEAGVKSGLQTAFAQISQVVQKRLGKAPDAQAIRELADQNPQWGKTIAGLVPYSYRNALFEGDRINNWVYEMFSMDPAKAEMHLFRNLMLTKWRSMEAGHLAESADKAYAYDKLTDRWHQLIFQLRNDSSDERWNAFFTALQQADSVDKFVAWVNKTIRISSQEPPFMAWVSDISDFAQDTKGISGGEFEGSLQREAFAEFTKATQNLVETIAFEERTTQKDKSLVNILKAEIRENPKNISRERRVLRETLDARNATLPPLGPSLRGTIVTELGIQMDATMHNKGQVPGHLKNEGNYEMRGENPGFMSQMEQIEGSLTAYDIDDVRQNMSVLARQGLLITDEEGRPVQWKPIDEETFLDLWMREDTRNALRQIYFPSVMDSDGADGVSQQYTAGTSLTELLNGEYRQKLLRNSTEARALYASRLDAIAGSKGHELAFTKLLNRFVHARLAGADRRVSANEMEREVQAAERILVDLLQEFGSIAASEHGSQVGTLATLYKTIEDQLKTSPLAKATGLKNNSALLQGLLEVTKRDSAEYFARRMNEAKDDPERIKEILEEEAEWDKRLEDMTNSSRFREAERKFDFMTDDPSSEPVVRTALLAYLEKSGTLATTRMPQAAMAISNALEQLSNRSQEAVTLSNAEWQLISQAVLTTHIHDLMTPTGVDLRVMPYPMRGDSARELMDPSYMYLLKDLIHPDSPLIAAAGQIYIDSRQEPMKVQMEFEDRANKVIERVIQPLGQWTMLTAQLTDASEKRLAAAASAAGVAVGGMVPKTQAAEDRATTRTDELPLEEHVSTVTLSMQQLAARRGNKKGYGVEQVDANWITTSIAGAVDDIEMPVELLNGRFARKVTVTYKGQLVSDNLLAEDDTLGVHYRKSERAALSDWQAITNKRLVRSIGNALTRLQLKSVDPADVSIQIEYLHPDSKPVSDLYANNVFFEGLSFDTAAAQLDSLTGEYWSVFGGESTRIQNQALSSQKKGKRAFNARRGFKPAELKQLEVGWQDDLGKVLQRKVLAMLGRDTGTGIIEPHYFSFLYKRQLLRHLVRGRVDGKAVVYSAEEFIHLQRTKQVPTITDIELYKVSPRTLRTMLNEQGRQGLRGWSSNVDDIDLKKIHRWSPTQQSLKEALARVPQIEELSVGSFAQTGLSSFAVTRTAKVRPALDSRARTRYEHAIESSIVRKDNAYVQRASSKMESVIQGFSKSNVEETLRLLKLSAKNFNFQALGLPPLRTDRQGELLLAEQVVRQYQDAVSDANSLRAYWRYVAGSREGVTKGQFNKQTIDSASKKGMELVPNDFLEIDLASIEQMHIDSLEAQREEGFEVAKIAMGRGAIIVLPDGGTGGDLRADIGRYILQHSYERVNGSQHIFRPIPKERTSQNIRALQSTLGETRGQSGRGVLLNILMKDAPIAENAAWVVNRNRDRSIAVVQDLIPTDFMGGYNAPATVEQWQAVTSQLSSMLTQPPSYLETLLGAKQKSKKYKDARRSLEKLVDFLASSGPENLIHEMLPTEFGTGDFIPLFDPQTKGILLYRHGYETPSRAKMLEQQATPFSSSLGGANIAISNGGMNPGHTVHSGTRIRTDTRSGFGLSVQMLVPLSLYLDKLQLEGSGFKLTTAPMDRKWLTMPDAPVVGQMHVDVMTDAGDVFSKNSFDGIVLSHRNSFAYLGVDFLGDLTKALLGEDLSTDPHTAAIQEATVQGMIEAIQKALAPQRLPMTAVDELMRGLTPEATLADMLSASDLSGSEMGELLDSLRTNAADPSSQIATGIVFYMLGEGAKLEHVLRASGFTSADAAYNDLETRLMPSVFTGLFDRQALDSPLRNEMHRRANNQLGEGYYLRKDWTLEITGKNGVTREGYLQFAEAHSSGDNPVLTTQADARQVDSRQQLSTHIASVARMSTGAEAAHDKELVKLQRFLDEDALTKNPSLFDMFKPAVDAEMTKLYAPKGDEPRHIEEAYRLMTQFRKKIKTGDWDKAKGEVANYEAKRAKVGAAYGLNSDQSRVVDFWVRQMFFRPLEQEHGNISYAEAMETLDYILENAIKFHALPTYGAMVPQIHSDDLTMLYEASLRNDTFVLHDQAIDGTEMTTWENWVNVALGVGHPEQKFDPIASTANDGFMHTFIGLDDVPVGLPISHDALIAAGLMKEDGTMDYSWDPTRAQVLRETMVPGTALTAEQLLQSPRSSSDAPSSLASQRRAAIRRWRKDTGAAEPYMNTQKNFREQGAEFKGGATTTNGLLRVLTDLRVGTTLLNPALFVSAWGETAYAGFQSTLANLVTGESIGAAGQLSEKFFHSTRYSAEQMGSLQRLIHTLGTNTDFRAMVYKEGNFQRHRTPNMGLIERGTSWLAQKGSLVQDPTYGMRANTQARRYLEGALAYVARAPELQNYSVDTIIQGLKTDANWLATHIPAAHSAGAAALMNTRQLKPTIFSLALRGIYEPLSNHPNMGVATVSTLALKLPLMFSTYMFNVGTRMLGLQAFSSGAAMVLHGRKKPKAWLRAQRFLGGEAYIEQDTFDMDSVIESADLAQAVVQSGVSLTTLFAGAMLSGGLGLTGEDEESKRRRRMMQLQGLSNVYDPREIENDFRNQDAIFLDNLPFGLSSLFRVTPEGSESGDRSMAQMHWMLKQFVSPIMGMDRFFQTGDWRQIMWGFQDALGSYPLINDMMWADANLTAAELAESALRAEELGTPEALPAAFSLWTKVLMTYENMLLENSFINQLYVAYDEYDRDPYVIPMVDAEGNILTDKMGNPMKTDALNSYYNAETGEIKEGYATRGQADAAIRGYAENRLSLGLLLSLVTGQPNFFGSDYNRRNMAVKTRKINLEQLDQEEAEGLLLSMFDEEVGTEVLTQDGARAVFRGLWKGSVDFNSPALNGVYIPYEMRETIQKEWMEEIVVEGIEAGLDEAAAKKRMQSLWFGPYEDPTIPGLKDYLWSDQIPYSATVVYNQLNTTYIKGPDGNMWATGVPRAKLMGALGLAPLQRFYTNEKLNVDDRLNNTDEVFNLNTGMRGLERTHESWAIPTDEQLAAKLTEDLEDILNKNFSDLTDALNSGNGWKNYGRGGWRNYGRRSYGSGYGSGYTSFTRTNTPPRVSTPYANDIRSDGLQNVNIRRANIRRERFQSQRGRLKEWQ